VWPFDTTDAALHNGWSRPPDGGFLPGQSWAAP
jgi:hypothetical protein